MPGPREYQGFLNQEEEMDDLGKMISFLKDTGDTLQGVTAKIDTLMTYYNSNFNSVNTVRNDEYRFLESEFFTHSEQFPRELREGFEKETSNQEKLFRENRQKLKEKLDAGTHELKSLDKKRESLLATMKSKNQKLDTREEMLKTHISEHDIRIAEYNKKIDLLNSGFGFILNFFKMRKIQKTKEDILAERDVLIDEIESVRCKWQEASEEIAGEEKSLREEWNNRHVEKAIIAEKLEYLQKNSGELVRKAALHTLITSLSPDSGMPAAGLTEKKPETCGACKIENTTQHYFCRYCGSRFSGDRRDVAGSLVEIGELNTVYALLENGMKQSVSFLALTKGILQGIQEFVKSVESVKKSQDTYSALPKLRISVPQSSAAFAEKIHELARTLGEADYHHHPLEFSKSVTEYTDSVFTEKQIAQFFNAMGDELNKTTKEQW